MTGIGENGLEKYQKTQMLDELTGLNTTRTFREKAPRFMADMAKDGNKPCYVFFDVDHFKTYNETYGFEAGDRVLKEIADVLTKTFVFSLIARLSGDHFVVLTDSDSIEKKIRASQERIRNAGQGSIVAKAGIYMVEDLEMDVSSAYDRARIALMSIKGMHDQSYCFYEEDMGDKLYWQNYIVDHLEEAVDKDYIVPYYQPIVDLKDGSIVAAEALARWKDPEYGVITPDKFIGPFEEIRLVQRVDSHILNDVCEELSIHVKMGAPVVPVSVNISQMDFEEIDIVEMINDSVNEHGISPSMLRIEITESSLTTYHDYVKEDISRLHKLGYKVWMDDFGSGYSSLNVLQEYDFDLIKLDRKFLENLESNPKTGVIIRACASMARELGMLVLAEGVETKEQADYLRGAGVELIQGFYFGRPDEKYVLDLNRGW